MSKLNLTLFDTRQDAIIFTIVIMACLISLLFSTGLVSALSSPGQDAILSPYNNSALQYGTTYPLEYLVSNINPPANITWDEVSLFVNGNLMTAHNYTANGIYSYNITFRSYGNQVISLASCDKAINCSIPLTASNTMTFWYSTSVWDQSLYGLPWWVWVVLTAFTVALIIIGVRRARNK
jgi:hypothetical protein